MTLTAALLLTAWQALLLWELHRSRRRITFLERRSADLTRRAHTAERTQAGLEARIRHLALRTSTLEQRAPWKEPRR